MCQFPHAIDYDGAITDIDTRFSQRPVCYDCCTLQLEAAALR